MKLRYILKQKFKESKGYIIALCAIILVLVVGGSYALFTATSESKGSLNIVTGDLKTYIESNELDSDNDVVLKPNEVRTVTIILKNVNPIEAKYNLYYSFNKADADVEIGYLSTGDVPPNTEGETMGKHGSDTDTKTVKIRILNNGKENVTVNFGSNVGLVNDILNFPEGKGSLQKIESNVIQSYVYSEDPTINYCVSGEEETCQKTTCLENEEANSCAQGTIVRYAVNDTESRYFYVLHDDGSTMTLQQRENTVRNTMWISKEDYKTSGGTEEEYGESGNNTRGPLTTLAALEKATSSWSNVNEQTYELGVVNFNNTNSFTGCSTDGTEINCNLNKYTLNSRNARARMITLQEARATGCLVWQNDWSAEGSCPDWMHNYLYQAKSFGGSYEDNTTNEDGSYNYDYWTMSAVSEGTMHAWTIYRHGALSNSYISSANIGSRAVVVINKNS